MTISRRLVLPVLLLALGTGLAAEPGGPNEGRGSFLLQQIPLGIWYGFGTAAFLTNDNTSAKVQTAVGLLSASAFYFGPLILVWNKPMTNAQAHLAVAAGYRGIGAGFALGDLFRLGEERVWDPYYRQYYVTFNARPRMGLMVLTSLGSQVGGYFLARDMSLGQAALVTAWSDFGWTDGMLAGLADADLADGDREVRFSGWYLGGLAAGATAGWLSQRNWDCTEGQVTFVRTAGFLGTMVPFGVVHALTGLPFESSEDNDAFAWIGPLMIAGNIGAALGAERLIRDAPLGTGEGYVTLGCTVAGALFGAGVGWLLTDEYSDRASRPIVGIGTLGAVGGLALGLRLTSGWNAAFSAAPARPGDSWSRLHVNTGELAGALTGLASGSGFSAPRLVVFEF